MHTLPSITSTTCREGDGVRTFDVTTVDGPATVVDRLDGHYHIEYNGQSWRTTTPPPGLFGGA